MENTKIQTISQLFEGKEIRSIWNPYKEDYYFSVVDVIDVLTDSGYDKSRNYWKWLKSKLIDEGSELVSLTNQLKMKAKDGKLRETDTLNTKGIFRLIESVPTPKAEPFKMWLANLGSERVDEVFDPEKAIKRAIDYYRKKGYDDKWIESRMKATLDRKKLTDIWRDGGITEEIEYAILTNDMYKEWSGMNAQEYKMYKGIRKENLRDNMSRIEVLLTDLGETVAHDIAKNEKPIGLSENRKVAKRGGKVAKKTKDFYEETTGLKAITKDNSLNYKYNNTVEEAFKNYDGPNLAKEFEWDEPRGKEVW